MTLPVQAAQRHTTLLDVGWYLQCPHVSRCNLGCGRSRQRVSVPILCQACALPPCKPPGQQRVCSSASYEGTKTLQFLTCKAIPFSICLLPQSLPPVVMVFSSQSQLLAPALHVGLLFVFPAFPPLPAISMQSPPPPAVPPNASHPQGLHRCLLHAFEEQSVPHLQ